MISKAWVCARSCVSVGEDYTLYVQGLTMDLWGLQTNRVFMANGRMGGLSDGESVRKRGNRWHCGLKPESGAHFGDRWRFQIMDIRWDSRRDFGGTIVLNILINKYGMNMNID